MSAVVDTAEELVSPARTAAVLGIVSMALHMSGCCTSLCGITAGTICGGAALFVALGVRRSEPAGAAGAYASVGFATGIISVVWGILVVIGILLYVLLYVGMFAAMMIAGSL